MARLKACSVCGKIHSSDIRCTRADERADQEHRLRQKNKWKEKSKDIRERSLWLCAVCRDEGIINHESLEVHHIKKLRDYPEGLTEDENLICLCTEHHKLADAGEIDEEYLRRLAQARDDVRERSPHGGDGRF